MQVPLQNYYSYIYCFWIKTIPKFPRMQSQFQNFSGWHAPDP